VNCANCEKIGDIKVLRR